MSAETSLEDRVYIERVKQFYLGAAGNAINGLIGGVLIAIILSTTTASHLHIGLWFGVLVLFSVIAILIERGYAKDTITIKNASKMSLFSHYDWQFHCLNVRHLSFCLS